MNMHSEGTKLTRVKAAQTAATSAVNSDSVDMAGYEGAMFFFAFGTAASDNTAHLAQSSDDAVADAFADLTGTSVTSGASDEVVWIDCWRPRERYLRCEVARGTSSTTGDIFCLQYGAKTQPVDNTTTGTIAGERHQSPAEGTA